jgi:hypothetical protein
VCCRNGCEASSRFLSRDATCHVHCLVELCVIVNVCSEVKWLTGKSTVATVGSDARQVGLRFVTGFGEAFRYCRRVTVDDHSSLHFQDFTSILDLIGAVVNLNLQGMKHAIWEPSDSKHHFNAFILPICLRVSKTQIAQSL